METDRLQEYFETLYSHGGLFRSPDYEICCEFDHAWFHRPTGIVIWKDALHLSSKQSPKVYFHYTSHPDHFRNLTSLREPTEIWEALKNGPGAKAWWGHGVYSLPKPPDEWKDRDELLDNNFRNVMRGDLSARSEAFMKDDLSRRLGFCIPMLIDAENAYDLSQTRTNEAEACGVVLHVDESCAHAAQARLMEVLRHRVAEAQDAEVWTDAKARLGRALLERGKHEEALEHLQEALDAREFTLGEDHRDTLESLNCLALSLDSMGRLDQAELLYRRAVAVGARGARGYSQLEQLTSTCNLGSCWRRMGRLREAEKLLQPQLRACERRLGREHFLTQTMLKNLSRSL
ncbi:Kinesin light chain 1 (KLC 1) [Durusdinium trenchii]|uniref:Kinesin light chain 1 (KLC 1) n=2 Tax=Durusdinium trenchii TaxID=1381693 RepID=A0ABP0LWD0_9DINO